jgi:hypothetical protein
MPLQLTDLIMIERGGVLYQGTVSQIAILLGGGGGIIWDEIKIPASDPFLEEMEYVHVDALVSPSSNIIIMFVENDHNDNSDFADDGMKIHAKAESGQIRINIAGNGYMCGPYNVKYGVS